jgi:hypothetical protein
VSLDCLLVIRFTADLLVFEEKLEPKVTLAQLDYLVVQLDFKVPLDSKARQVLQEPKDFRDHQDILELKA